MGEMINITSHSGAWGAYLARPARCSAPAVVVLHELFGVNADMRQTCDELAAHGFLALCPDLIWRQSPGVDLDVRSQADWDTGMKLYSAYDRDLGVYDVAETVEFARELEGASGQVGVLGYCIGAPMTFLAAARTSVDAGVAFHGADTERYLDETPAISAPLLMHLAGEDEFMPPAAQAEIAVALASKRDAELHIYPGCHHAFSRHGGALYDAAAAALANRRTHAFLAANLNGRAHREVPVPQVRS